MCEHAQQWANHLGSTNEFYYRSDKNLGQNLFCCPVSALVTDLTGEETCFFFASSIQLQSLLQFQVKRLQLTGTVQLEDTTTLKNLIFYIQMLMLVRNIST